MKNGNIPEENIQASASRASEPAQARLDGASSWAAPNSEIPPWIQANIGYQTYVSGVVTQGKSGIQTWVTSIKVSTFLLTTSDQEVFVTDEMGNYVSLTCLSKGIIY